MAFARIQDRIDGQKPDGVGHILDIGHRIAPTVLAFTKLATPRGAEQ
jgi:hypothetical protein